MIAICFIGCRGDTEIAMIYLFIYLKLQNNNYYSFGNLQVCLHFHYLLHFKNIVVLINNGYHTSILNIFGFFTEGNSVTSSQFKVPSSPMQNLVEGKGKLFLNNLLTTNKLFFILCIN